MSKILELAGQRFGKLTVKRVIVCRPRVLWLCKCDCGKFCIARGDSVPTQKIPSCGCARVYKLNVKHSHSSRKGNSPTYITWQSMKQRCFNSNKRCYKNYGGRGITVCQRWMVFENFLLDMGERPVGKTIERKNNNGNYEPGNCCWATMAEQNNNQRPKKRRTDG